MLAVTRRTEIKDIIMKKGSITVAELAQIFSVTEETIRRDLKYLEDEKFLTRTYGGAYIQENVESELDLSLRETLCIDSKQAIAKRCIELIRHGDTIFLDTSTTALYIAIAIRDMPLTVLTNSLLVIEQLQDCENIHLIAIGGNYSHKVRAFLGQTTVHILKNYFVDKTFISCRTLSMEYGITDADEAVALVRQKIIKQSNAVYLIADYTKFDRTSFISVCNFDSITGLFTDKLLNNDWLTFLEEHNVTVYECHHSGSK